MVSRSTSQVYNGSLCPDSISFGFVHGSSPAIATVKYDETEQSAPAVNIGQIIGLMLDRSFFVGFVSKKEVAASDDTGDQITTLTVVDWRDTLHDDYIFAAFNVSEPDGRHWHLLPEDWELQRKTWISEKLQQQDYFEIQNHTWVSGLIPLIAKQKLLSAATILNILGEEFNFTWSAEATASEILKSTYPMNLNWESGVTGAIALDDLLGKCNARMTCNKPGEIYITLKGFMPQSLLDAFLAGLTNHCSFGATEGSVGTEINEEGRHVHVVGGRDKYQFMFPCRQNWNQKFSFQMVYNAFYLSALMQKHGLNPSSKLKELPEAYHDDETWMEHNDGFGIGAGTDKRTRNEMSIIEYTEKICFKSYIVDFTRAAFIGDNFPLDIIDDDINGTWSLFDRDELDFTVDDDGNLVKSGFFVTSYPWTSPEPPVPAANVASPGRHLGVNSFNSFAPISDALVTESNTNFLAFITSREIVQGKAYPFERQLHYVPVQEGVSFNVEEVLNRVDARTEYRCRLDFSGPEYILEDLKKWNDPTKVVPDKMLVALTLEGKVYTYQKGNKTGVKSRSQKLSTENLYKSFVNGNEVVTLAWNFIRNLEDEGATPGLRHANADFIAEKMADKMLLHLALNKAGHLKFEDRAGFTCNGLIESVNVSFNSTSGLTEIVNFTRTFLDTDDEGNAKPRVDIVSKELGLSIPIRTEKDINRDRLVAIAKSAIKQAKANAKNVPKNNPVSNAAVNPATAVPMAHGNPSGVSDAAMASIKVIAADLGQDYTITLNDLSVVGSDQVHDP